MPDVPYFLKRDNDSILFKNDGEMIFYIPDSYFEKKFALIMGEIVRLFGEFNYSVFDEKGKSETGLKVFDFPTVFLSKPSKIEKVKNLQLKDYMNPMDYTLLKFKKDDVVIISTKVPQMADNAEDLFRVYNTGKFPNILRYDKLHELFPINLRLNGGNYGLSAQIFGVYVAETCRDNKDITKLFRYTNMDNIYAYQVAPILQIPKYMSPFMSVTSENWDDAVTNAIVNKNVKYSPMEKILMT